ncbi:hypothetical protein [Roseiconus lacunae]|uniref:hypothetical protein n=1 Tax=Roseiconus lacunae TaxID=2605694 RepID=UPI001E2E85C4|nr:hypothetical protein [Roseiconus lacunae]
MIPAILSCVFVIYLYRMLQQPSGASEPRADDSSQQYVSEQQVSERLAALQRRVDRLGDHDRGGQA